MLHTIIAAIIAVFISAGGAIGSDTSLLSTALGDFLLPTAATSIAYVRPQHASQTASAAGATSPTSTPNTATSTTQQLAHLSSLQNSAPQNSSSSKQHLSRHISTPPTSQKPPSPTTIHYHTTSEPTPGYVLGAATSAVDAVTHSQLDAALNALRSQLFSITASAPSFSGPAASTPVSFQTFSTSQKIDQLTNTTITTPTINTPAISGGTISGATVSGYLPLAGGTLTGALTGTALTLSGNLTVSGAQTLSGAITVPYVAATSTLTDSSFLRLTATNATTTNATTTSLFANSGLFNIASFGQTATSSFGTDGSLILNGALTANGNSTLTNATTSFLFVKQTISASQASFGATGTSSFSTAGALTLSSPLAVTSGGTGWSAIQSGTIPYGNGSSALSTTSAGTAGQVLALLNGVPTWASTTTLSTISGTLGVANGGTNATSFNSHMLLAYDGTRFVATSTPTAAAYLATSTSATTTLQGTVLAASGGNVGIGTASPVALLTLGSGDLKWSSDQGGNIGGSGNSGRPSFIYSTNLAVGASAASTNCGATCQTTFGGTVSVAGGLYLNQSAAYIDESSGMRLHGDSTHPIKFINGASAEVARIDVGTGDFGIGTTSPAQLLSVQGNALLSGNLSAANITATGTLSVTGNTTLGNASTTQIGSTGAAYFATGSGNVGIGTTSPFGSLAIKGSAANIGLVVQGSNGAADLQQWYSSAGVLKASIGDAGDIGTVDGGKFFIDSASRSGGVSYIQESSGFNIVSGSGRDIILSAGGLTRLTVKNDTGNVGIGTTTPAQLLSVQGNALLSGNLSAANITATGTITFSGLGTHMLLTSNGSGAVVASSTPTAANYLATSTTATTTLSGMLAVGSNALNVLTNGNVGIGTAAPTAKLDVNGQSRFVNGFEVTGAAGNNNNSLLVSWDGAGGKIQTYSSLPLILNALGNNVGIGTTSPASLLALHGSAPVFTLGDTQASSREFQLRNGSVAAGKFDIYDLGNAASRLTIDGSGNLGIGTTSPWRTLSVTGTVGFDGLTSTSTAGDSLCLSNLKEVTLRSGNTCSAASSIRYKQDISTLTATSGLAEVLALNPVSFSYTPSYLGSLIKDPNWAGQRVGFIAEEVQKIDPRLITVDSTGQPDTVRYENVTAILVKAIQELARQIADFADRFATKELTFTRATGDDLTLSHQLCIKKSDGTQACVTGDQLAALLSAAAAPAASGSVSSSASNSRGASAQNPSPDPTKSVSSATSATASPPVIHINGENPAHIHVGDTYQDLGATIAAPEADKNLGIKTFLNAKLVSDIMIDTSKVATDTIDYVVTNPAGLAATSTRTIVIEFPAASPKSSTPDATSSSQTATSTTP